MNNLHSFSKLVHVKYKQTYNFLFRRILKRTVMSKKQIAAKVIAELNKHLDSASMIAVNGNFINSTFTAEQQFPNHFKLTLMPKVACSGVTQTEPDRLVSGKE